jgi:4-carboxymuconolactone decarboxylase
MKIVPLGKNSTISERGARVPLLSVEEMSEDQRRLHDQVVSGPRGMMIGPLRAAIHSPELAQLWSAFGEFLRFRTCLPVQLTELAILVTGRRWTSQVEWWVHARIGAEAGLAPSVIEAIRDLASPIFVERSHFEVYEYARLLQQDGQVPVEVHQAIHSRWGTRGVVELTAVIGYYTMVAMTLNAHLIPVPEESPPLQAVPSLVTLSPATLLSDG